MTPTTIRTTAMHHRSRTRLPSPGAARVAHVLLLLAVALSAGCNEARGDKAQLPAKPPKAATSGAPSGQAKAGAPPAGSATPGTGDDGSIKLTGTAAAHRQSLVSVSGMGLIVKLHVREGDFVKKGQVLCQLDASGSALRLRQAKAALELAKVQQAGAERERGRLQRLKKDNAVAGAQVDQAATGYDAASAGVAQAQAAVAMASKAVADSIVRAPFAGLVVQRLKAEGEWVSTMPPAPIIMLAEVDPLDVTIQAPEHLMTKIQKGDPVSVHFAATDKTVAATVTRVVPMVRPPARSFTVIVELPNPDGELQPGLFAEVTFKLRDQPAKPTENDEGKPVAKTEGEK